MPIYTSPQLTPEVLFQGSVPSVRQSLDRRTTMVATLALGATSTMSHVGVPAYAGDVITNITIKWGSVAPGAPTNWWFALYDTQATPALIAQTADQLTVTPTTSGIKLLALTGGPYTLSATGIYYVGVSVTSSNTMPTLTGISNTIITSAGLVTGQSRLSGVSGSALAGTAPGTIASVTTGNSEFYAALS